MRRSIRARLELAGNLRDLALFNLAIDSKLRGCDLVPLRVADLVIGDTVRERVSIIQRKTRQPVQFEVSENTRQSILGMGGVAGDARLSHALSQPVSRLAASVDAAVRAGRVRELVEFLERRSPSMALSG